MLLDDHGQPPRIINAQRVADRGTDELIGLCKGILVDEIVTQDEAEFLQQWLRQNEGAKTQWPGNILHTRIYEYLKDGILDIEEKEELFELLKCFVGATDSNIDHNVSTALPFDSPMPPLNIVGELYCFTGRMNYGTRNYCQSVIKSLGGHICTTPRQQKCVVVVGYLGSRDWIHSTHGRKIEKAVGYRERGLPVAIISEEHWANELDKAMSS
ncbi:MAG: NAD-dependent DNA ligase [Desulfovibrionaceae bacterium]|nr:NAD-dependent DNA ligase [Desulfovibrionaceae bacterium]